MTPEDYKRLLKEAFESTFIGQTFRFRRTFTDGDSSLFCGITGDYNPYHIDDVFAEASFFKRRMIPGLLTVSMATHLGGMIGFVASEMHFEFLAPVYMGDTITCEVKVTEKDHEKRQIHCEALFTNQESTLVSRGWVRGFPSLVRLAK